MQLYCKNFRCDFLVSECNFWFGNPTTITCSKEYFKNSAEKLISLQDQNSKCKSLPTVLKKPPTRALKIHTHHKKATLKSQCWSSPPLKWESPTLNWGLRSKNSKGNKRASIYQYLQETICQISQDIQFHHNCHGKKSISSGKPLIACVPINCWLNCKQRIKMAGK